VRRKNAAAIAVSCNGGNYQIVVANRQDKNGPNFYSNTLIRNGGGNGGASFAGFLVWNTFYFSAITAFVRFSCLAGNSIVLRRPRSTTAL
jgi:hypothetical protein